MKRLWLAIGILAAIVTLCLSSILYQQRQTSKLLEQLDSVITAFDNRQTDHAYALAVVMKNDYQHHERLFSCFMAHDDLVECRESLALLPSLLRDGNAEEFHIESVRCRIHLQHLSDSELPTLQNIL